MSNHSVTLPGAEGSVMKMCREILVEALKVKRQVSTEDKLYFAVSTTRITSKNYYCMKENSY